MRSRIEHSLADDLAAASAACLFNSLPEIRKLSASEAYERLQTHIYIAIVAYADAANHEWVLPEPSDN